MYLRKINSKQIINKSLRNSLAIIIHLKNQHMILQNKIKKERFKN